MATAERTIVDPTQGLELVNFAGEKPEATRHLFLAANLLDPARQRDINLPYGGEELINPCLKRTYGRLPKCEITPLEFWVEWLPKELFPQGMEHLALTLKDQEQFNPSNRIFKPLFGYPHYPVNLIVDAIGIAAGERRGIVEIQKLFGVDYGKEDREMQDLFFPADWPKPVELRLIGERIEQVADSVADPDVKDVAADMMASVVQSREYMTNVLDIGQTQLNQRVVSGPGFHYTYRLTPKLRSFAEQLEVKLNTNVPVQETINQAVTANLPPELLEQLATQNTAIANLGPLLGEAIGKAIKEAVAAASKPPKQG